jgi:hypothetical protein
MAVSEQGGMELVWWLRLMGRSMTNPQLSKNLLEVIRSLPDEDRRWLLEQLRQEATDRSSQDLAEPTQAGQAFDDLAQEPELYSFTAGEPAVAA